MDRVYCFKKLDTIINDRSKFKHLGPAEKYNRTARAETKLNKVLREFKYGEELLESTYNVLSPQVPRARVCVVFRNHTSRNFLSDPS